MRFPQRLALRRAEALRLLPDGAELAARGNDAAAQQRDQAEARDMVALLRRKQREGKKYTKDVQHKNYYTNDGARPAPSRGF